jgi:hypothetical protein
LRPCITIVLHPTIQENIPENVFRLLVAPGSLRYHTSRKGEKPQKPRRLLCPAESISFFFLFFFVTFDPGQADISVSCQNVVVALIKGLSTSSLAEKADDDGNPFIEIPKKPRAGAPRVKVVLR